MFLWSLIKKLILSVVRIAKFFARNTGFCLYLFTLLLKENTISEEYETEKFGMYINIVFLT